MKSSHSLSQPQHVDRLGEVCHILALGVLRMKMRQEHTYILPPSPPENSVDFLPPTERSCCRSQEKGDGR
jgi:hypothetical protein